MDGRECACRFYRGSHHLRAATRRTPSTRRGEPGKLVDFFSGWKPTFLNRPYTELIRFGRGDVYLYINNGHLSYLPRREVVARLFLIYWWLMMLFYASRWNLFLVSLNKIIFGGTAPRHDIIKKGAPKKPAKPTVEQHTANDAMFLRRGFCEFLTFLPNCVSQVFVAGLNFFVANCQYALVSGGDKMVRVVGEVSVQGRRPDFIRVSLIEFTLHARQIVDGHVSRVFAKMEEAYVAIWYCFGVNVVLFEGRYIRSPNRSSFLI